MNVLPSSLARLLAAIAWCATGSVPALSQEVLEVLKSDQAISENRAADSMPGLEYFVDGMVSATMKRHTLPGVTVSIVKDGKIVLLKGYGVVNSETRDPVDPERACSGSARLPRQ